MDDAAIAARIKTDHERYGYVWCPHSACAAEAYDRLEAPVRAERDWRVAATAHPYKFADRVEPVIGSRIEPPDALKAVLDRPFNARPCKAELSALSEHLDDLESLPA